MDSTVLLFNNLSWIYWLNIKFKKIAIIRGNKQLDRHTLIAIQDADGRVQLLKLDAFLCISDVTLSSTNPRAVFGVRQIVCGVTTLKDGRFYEYTDSQGSGFTMFVFSYIFRSTDVKNIEDNNLIQWGTRNPLDGDTSFVGFITNRSMQSVFPGTPLKLIRHRQ